MKMDSLQKKWESILAKEGMPSEILSEEKVAAKAGVKMGSLDIMADPEAKDIAEKLRLEDARNIFGGFPNNIDTLISLVKDLKGEWLKQNIPSKDIHLAVHSSCINGYDCVALAHNGEEVYHYNVKNIIGYSRKKLTSKLQADQLSFIEK
jgi:hypothetical protein